LLDGVEEFALFFLKNFRAELDLTLFFYRSLYAQFSFNLENAIKVIYCLHKMTVDEGEGVEDEPNHGFKEEDHMADYDQYEEDNQYGDYGEEVDYGDEGDYKQEDEDEADEVSHSDHSKHYHEGDE
jgi:hypothetical protein